MARELTAWYFRVLEKKSQTFWAKKNVDCFRNKNDFMPSVLWLESHCLSIGVRYHSIDHNQMTWGMFSCEDVRIVIASIKIRYLRYYTQRTGRYNSMKESFHSRPFKNWKAFGWRRGKSIWRQMKERNMLLQAEERREVIQHADVIATIYIYCSSDCTCFIRLINTITYVQ